PFSSSSPVGLLTSFFFLSWVSNTSCFAGSYWFIALSGSIPVSPAFSTIFGSFVKSIYTPSRAIIQMMKGWKGLPIYPSQNILPCPLMYPVHRHAHFYLWQNKQSHAYEIKAKVYPNFQGNISCCLPLLNG